MNKVDKPLFSIVTVCLNTENLIEKTLQSVIKQTFNNKEYLIIDGISTDNTLSIIDKYKDNIDILVSEKDKGIYDAMNKAVNKANGKWIIFMNAGDTFADENTLTKVANELNDKKYDIIYGDVLVSNNGENPTLKKAENPTNKHRMYFCHQSAFVRTDLLLKYPFDIKYTMSADFKFFKEMFLKSKQFYQLDFPIAVFNKEGISNTQRNKGLLQNVKIIKEVDNFTNQLKFLPRLYFTIYWNKLRKKA